MTNEQLAVLIRIWEVQVRDARTTIVQYRPKEGKTYKKMLGGGVEMLVRLERLMAQAVIDLTAHPATTANDE